MFVEPADAPQFADAVGLVKDTWLNASVAFDGAFAGAVEIMLPEPLGKWLVTSLLGMQGDERLGEPQLFDGVGEFANMVCGAWLSKAQRDCLVRARVPAVTRMTAGWTPARRHARPAGAGLPDGDVNELPLRGPCIRSSQQAA